MNALNQKVTTTINGTFSKVVGGLNTNSTYYYKAYVKVTGYGDYISISKEIYGKTSSFSTSSSTTPQFAYSGCLEMPAMNPQTSSTFKETFGGTTGYKHTVQGNSNQTIVNHTINSDGLKRNYSMLYDKTKFGALWVSYIMHNGYHPDKNVGRNDRWTNDPAIASTDQQTGATYGSRGYSRGHQIASSDRQNSVDCNRQTFYHTNILPQWQNGFNGGIWNSLEQAIQGWAPAAGDRDSIYVVTGPVYSKTVNGGAIHAGGREIIIPSHFYKAVIKCKFSGTHVSSVQGIGFYFENKANSGSYKDDQYVKSIDWIEQQTGFDLFANLPNEVERAAEANTNFNSFLNF